MSKFYKMICKLTRPVVTKDGDFIPKGTPVEVLRWADDQQKIEVKTKAYMYCNDAEGSIHTGLIIEVDPIDLEYKDSFSINSVE